MANILVIDDEIEMLELVASVLRLDGHLIIATSSPLEGIEIAIRGRGEIDLVLADVSLKPISWLMLTSPMGKQGFDIPVLLMSAPGSIVTAIMHAAGGYPFIGKPFAEGELRRAVQAVLTATPAKSGSSATRTEGPAEKMPTNTLALWG